MARPGFGQPEIAHVPDERASGQAGREGRVEAGAHGIAVDDLNIHLTSLISESSRASHHIQGGTRGTAQTG